MKATQRLVRNIQSVLEAGRSSADIDVASLAADYSQRCSEANERLRLCKRYLSRGMLSEAMHAAESKPVLLDLCAALDFVGVEEWASLCGKSNWSIPEWIDSASLAVLNEHYASAIALEPVLKRYRRAVREKNTGQCIQILHQLISIAPDSKNWQEDLQAFEKRRISEIEAAYPAATQQDDSATLASFLQELEREWVIQLDPSLKNAVNNAYGSVRKKEATEEGRKLVVEISEAYSALDYKDLLICVQRYQALLADGYFHPDANTALQFDEANAWFLAEKARRDADLSYETDLNELHVELRREPPTENIERVWMSLLSHKRDIPNDLAKKARAAIETYKILAFRRKRRILVGGVCATLAVVAAILATVWRVQYLREELHWCGQLKQAFESYDLAGFEQIMGEIPEYRSVLFGNFLATSQGVQEWGQRAGELKQRVDERTAKFDEKCAVLEVIREQNFKEDAVRIAALMDEARELAFTEDQHPFVQRFEMDWRTNSDSLINALTRDLALKMPAITAFWTNSFPVVEEKIISASKILQEALTIKGASPATYQRLTSYEAEIDDLKYASSRRARKYSRIASANSVVRYVEAIAEYSNEFPDDLLSKTADQVVNIGSEAYRDFLGIWQEQNLLIKKRTATISKTWLELQRTIDALGEEELLSDLHFYEDKDVLDREPTVRFLKGEFKEVAGSIRNYNYRGKVYVPTSRDQIASFWDRTVPRSIRNSVAPMWHCEILRSTLSNLDRVQPQDALSVLLGTIDELVRTPVWDGEQNATLKSTLINSFLKMKLVSFFSRQAVTLTVTDKLPQLEAAIKDMRAADDPTLEWLCIKNSKIGEIDKVCAGVLDKHFSNCDWMLQRRLVSLAEDLVVTRGVQWVGSVHLYNSGTVNWRMNKPKEAWVARPTASENLVLRVALLQSANGKYRLCTPLLPGEPLLAPTDGSVTSVVLRKMCTEAGIKDVTTVSKLLPKNWPTELKPIKSGE